MMYTFRRAVPSDIEKIKNNSTENGKVDDNAIKNSDEIRVMECDGEPVMVIGCIRYPGEEMIDTLGVWGIFSKDIKKHTKEAVKFCKDLIFSRVGTKFVVLIDESNPTFSRFVKFFGFQRTKIVEENEGTVYHLYVKVN